MDLVKLRALKEELGFWPATTDPDDIDRHRAQNAEAGSVMSSNAAERISRRYRHLSRCDGSECDPSRCK